MPSLHPKLNTNGLRTLYAQSLRITLAPSYYRGCWHGVSRNLGSYRHHLHHPHTFTTVAFFDHGILLGQAVAHCPIVLTAASYGAWTLSQFQCGCASFPDQLRIIGSLRLPNPTQTYLTAINLLAQGLIQNFFWTVRQPACYTHPSATTVDSHVSCIPLAFILSQDQTQLSIPVVR